MSKSQAISEVFNYLNKYKHNEVWSNLLAVRKVMATENMSFKEASSIVERETGERLDLNLDTISVYYSLYSIVCFKEDHEANIDFPFLETNKEYRNLKNQFDASHNNISFMANLRNFITHNTLEISEDGVEIFHPVKANGQPSRERFVRAEINSIIENLTTGLLKNGSMYKFGDPLKEFKDKKGMIFCPMGKASDILDANNPENFLVYDRTAVIFAFYKLNEAMLANPDVKLNDLLDKLIEETDQNPNSGFLKAEFKMMKNVEHLLANDAIHYASAIFSSKFYDEDYDYSSTETGIDGFKGENIGKIRHALMHGYYSIGDDKITIKKLTQEGEDKLRDFRKANKRRKNAPDQNIQTFIKENRDFDRCLEELCTITYDDLAQICNSVIKTYVKEHPEELGVETENCDEIEEEGELS